MQWRIAISFSLFTERDASSALSMSERRDTPVDRIKGRLKRETSFISE